MLDAEELVPGLAVLLVAMSHGHCMLILNHSIYREGSSPLPNFTLYLLQLLESWKHLESSRVWQRVMKTAQLEGQHQACI